MLHNKKNWMALNTVRCTQTSTMIYSITEIARANGLNVYYYVKHLLTEHKYRLEKCLKAYKLGNVLLCVI